MRTAYANLLASIVPTLVLAACIGTVHGGGQLTLLWVNTGAGPGELGPANIGVSMTCNQRTNLVTGEIAWNDHTNGVQFNAHLHKVPVGDLVEESLSCADAADIVEQEGASISLGFINTRGQESGEVAVIISKPGVAPECGNLQAVIVEANDPSLPGGFYETEGCLDHGTINFKD